MRRHGISGPVTPAPGPSQMFFPHQAARDLTVAAVVGVLLAVLAWKGAPALEPPADPTSSDYIPRPEWYFLGLFQLLKYFPGRLGSHRRAGHSGRRDELPRPASLARSRPDARSAAGVSRARAVHRRVW